MNLLSYSFQVELCLKYIETFLQYISYNTLLNELDVKNIRELEDLLISAIYADIIQGRLDQQNSRYVMYSS